MVDANKFKLKITLSEDDIKGVCIRLNVKEVEEHIFSHWRDVVIKRAMIDDVIVVMEDLDTNSMHEVNFRYSKCKNKNDCSIQGLWVKNFIERRNLKAGAVIGIYCDPVSAETLQALWRRICMERSWTRTCFSASAKFCFSVLKEAS